MQDVERAKSALEMFQTNLAALSLKESKAVAGVVAGKTKTQAMIDAGYAETTALERQEMVFGRERVQNVSRPPWRARESSPMNW